MVRLSAFCVLQFLGWISAVVLAQSDKDSPDTAISQNLGISQNALRALTRRQDPTKSGEMLALALGSLSNSFKHHPVSKVPTTQQQPSSFWPGAVQKKIRYGPYRVPARSVSS
jgi:hypothetical protein